MLEYIVKRILYSIPTLFIVCLISFFLSKASENDPVSGRLESSIESLSQEDYRAEYLSLSRQLKYDKPDFYFSIAPSHYPRTINKFIFPLDKSIAKFLLKHRYDQSLVSSVLDNLDTPDKGKFYANLKNDDFNASLNLINDETLKAAFKSYGGESSFSPSFRWHGSDNQFHNWFGAVLKGDFGVSYQDGRPVISKIIEALPYTLFMTLIALLISLLAGIILARWIVLKGSIFFVELIAFALYAVPVFWMATLALIFFTTDQYSTWLNWFPGTGVDYSLIGKSASYRFWHSLDRLLLPIICLSLHSIAFVMLQMKNSLRKEANLPYILTAKAKGLNKKEIIEKHQFRNALTPIITMIVASIPSILAGSLLVELIYNIPGMGRLIFFSIQNADWEVVFAVIIFSSIITIISYLVGDILYRKFNPKLSWQ